ncbi:hypothetical protein JAAARDRAFT_131792, partial [Jaapia argillacea MUCL 33604]
DAKPPKKRARTTSSRAEDDIPADSKYYPPEIWYDDGNVILIAEDTVFKVFMGFLSDVSRVFAKKLSAPSTDKPMGGCRVLKLTDSAEDITHLLKALHKRRHPFAVVRAVLRLGRKYGIDDLREDAIAILRADFPDTLYGCLQISRDGWQAIDGRRGTEIEAIRLAREIGLLKILPVAFYFGSQYDPPKVVELALHGITQDNGTVVKLSTNDQARLLNGRERLIRAQAKYSFAWLDSDDGCVASKKEGCRRAKAQLLRKLWYPFPKVVALLSWDKDWESGLCTGCIVTAKDAFEDGQMQVWDELPDIFDLLPWGELANHDDGSTSDSSSW